MTSEQTSAISPERNQVQSACTRCETTSYLATRWTAKRCRRAGCIYEGASLEEASLVDIDGPRRRFASSREHERVLTAVGLAGSVVRRESEGIYIRAGHSGGAGAMTRRRGNMDDYQTTGVSRISDLVGWMAEWEIN